MDRNNTTPLSTSYSINFGEHSPSHHNSTDGAAQKQKRQSNRKHRDQQHRKSKTQKTRHSIFDEDDASSYESQAVMPHSFPWIYVDNFKVTTADPPAHPSNYVSLPVQDENNTNENVLRNLDFCSWLDGLLQLTKTEKDVKAMEHSARKALKELPVNVLDSMNNRQRIRQPYSRNRISVRREDHCVPATSYFKAGVEHTAGSAQTQEVTRSRSLCKHYVTTECDCGVEQPEELKADEVVQYSFHITDFVSAVTSLQDYHTDSGKESTESSKDVVLLSVGLSFLLEEDPFEKDYDCSEGEETKLPETNVLDSFDNLKLPALMVPNGSKFGTKLTPPSLPHVHEMLLGLVARNREAAKVFLKKS